MLKPVFAGVCTLAAFCLFTPPAMADGVKQPNAHAPIGVMGDHLHRQGEWMLSYKFRRTATSGLRDGDSRVSNASVLETYGEVPAEMEMNMHMFELMYGVTDDLTLMVMPQYMEMDMLHASHGHHGSHTHEIEGFGDTEVTGLYALWRQEHHRGHLNLGLSLPTGSTDETFTNHHGSVLRLPYNMQLGSGTYDPIIGLTVTGESGDYGWGAQTLNYIRLGKNNEGYRQGNKYTLSGWVARNMTEFLSVSFRLEGEAWDDVHGRDSGLPLTAIAGADPDEQAGERLLAHVGLNLLAKDGPLAGHRLAAEFGVPVYERFDGPQPDTDYRLTLGWQWAF